MSWLTRFRNALHPRQLDEDLAEEYRDHLDRRAAELRGKGLDPAEAQRRAALVFGNAAGFREESREARLWAALDATCQDARYAWRGLLRNPVFAATAVLSLGLAIGANTAIYSIIDAVMMRPLAVPQPDRLFTLATPDSEIFSYPLYEQLREAAGDSGRVALLSAPNRVEAQGPSQDARREEIVEQFISPDAFEVLGVPPAAGALFSVAEDRYPGPRRVAVLSYDYWRRRFAADPAILGQTMNLNGMIVRVLGVVREGFTGAEPGKFVDVWLPVTLFDPGAFNNPEFNFYWLLGRLAPGSTREQLQARLQPTFHSHQLLRASRQSALPESVAQQLRDMKIEAHSGASGISSFRRTFARPLWILLGVACCILLIACANVASLLLARSTARSGELALRVSLGAGRQRLLRQLLTESLLISALAGAAGWLLARVAAPALVAMVSKKTDPIRLDLALDTRVLLFCAALCTLSALFFGLLPAWHAAGARPMFRLRHVSGQAGRLRLGQVFVGVQVAFAFCLVTGGAGFLFSLHNLFAVDTGFDARGVTVMTVTNSLGPSQRDRQLALMHQIRLRVAALPNVQGAAAAWGAIFTGGRRAERVVLPGKPPSAHEETFYRVSPGYFATLRTPLLDGRDFDPRDNDNEPVPTVVNRAFVRRYFGTESVLGKEFQRTDGTRHQIVGVAANSHYGDLRGGPEPIAYIPMKPPRGFTLYVRSTLDAASVMRMVDREASALGSGMRVSNATALETIVGNTILKEKLLAALGGAFALLGLVLAAVGLFGLLNYSVARRTKEIGIRAALGARKLLLVGLILRDLFGLMAGGLVLGLAGSVALMSFARSLLFGIQPADPRVIATAIAVFLLAAAIAGGLPARRAAAIDPIAALREE